METVRVEGQRAVYPVFQPSGHYRVEADSEARGIGILARLPAFPQTVRVGRDGGLLGHLSVWKNLTLPLEYGARDMRHVAEDAALLFMLCGESLSRLLDSYPDALSPYERRLVGFVRALLLEPEVLVLDGIFDGLAVAEKEKALRWVQVFRLRFPFRVLLYRGQEDEALNDMERVA